MGRQRDIASQLEDAMVGTGMVPKLARSPFILTFRFWKAKDRSSTGRIPHLLVILLPTTIHPSDASKAIILHPRLSNWAADHPEYNPFTSLNPIPGPPVYQKTTPSLEELLTKLEILKEEFRLGGLFYRYTVLCIRY